MWHNQHNQHLTKRNYFAFRNPNKPYKIILEDLQNE